MKSNNNFNVSNEDFKAFIISEYYSIVEKSYKLSNYKNLLSTLIPIISIFIIYLSDNNIINILIILFSLMFFFYLISIKITISVITNFDRFTNLDDEIRSIIEDFRISMLKIYVSTLIYVILVCTVIIMSLICEFSA